MSPRRYSGRDIEGEPMAGVCILAQPGGSGPIWNVVAEGTPEALPILEASALTVAWP